MRSLIPSPLRPAKPIDQTILKEDRRLVERIERRAFLRGTLSLGALTMLTGCDVTNKDATQSVLRAMSAWNDRVQSFLFSPTRLAREYPASKVMRPPRWNAFYGREMVKDVDPSTWKLELAGMIGDKRPWALRDIHALPEVTQRTRHVCASRAGTTLASGRACRSSCSWNVSVRTRQRSTSASSASTVTRARSI
jgi:Oxidoreductase molybdopterin binding domain